MSAGPRPQRVALVTGGSRGIGRAICRRLARSGIGTIIVNYLENEAAAAVTRQEVEAMGAVAHLLPANLAHPSEIDGLFDCIAQITERLDVFVHSAALGAFKPLSLLKANHWDLSMAVNARSFLLCVQKCVPMMPQGAVVAVSSLGGRRAVPNYGAIGASKAALEAMIRQLAMELAPRGIRLNGVAGGLIETESIAKFPDYHSMVKSVIEATPAGRIGQPDDIAEVVAFLISPEARWIHGQVLVADGGFSLM